MGAIGQILALSSSDMTNPANWLLEFAGGRKTTAGVSVTELKAMGVSSVFACVRNLAEDEAKLPLPIYEELPDGSREKRKDHAAYAVLNYEANPEMTAFNARQAITACAALYGCGYGEIIRKGSSTVGLVPLHPSQVTARYDDDQQLYYEIRGRNGTFDKTLYPHNVFELPGFGVNGILGEMIAKTGKESIGLCIAADQFASSFFGNGVNVGGILSHPGSPDKKQRKAIRDSFAKVHKGEGKGNKLMLTWDGITFTPTAVEPDKAQAVESRQFQVEEVARWFRMPPDKIGHLLRTKGWNTQEIANIAYLTDTLMSWFVRWEQEVRRKLIAPSDRKTMYAEHLTDALLRVDAKTRSIIHQVDFRNGNLTLDEWAKQENNRPPGGELGRTRWVMANMVPAEKLLVAPTGAKNGDGAGEGQPNGGRKNKNDDEGTADGPGNGKGGGQGDGKFRKDSGGYRRSVAIAAVRPVLIEAVSRLFARETLAAKRASKKYLGNIAEFGGWLDKFGEEQISQTIKYLSPGIEALAELLSVDVAGLVEKSASEHVEGLQSGLKAAFAKAAISETCDGWVPDGFVDYIISEVESCEN